MTVRLTKTVYFQDIDEDGNVFQVEYLGGTAKEDIDAGIEISDELFEDDGESGVEPEPEVAADEPEGLESLTVAELRDKAAEAGVEGYSSMRKSELIEALS